MNSRFVAVSPRNLKSKSYWGFNEQRYISHARWSVLGLNAGMVTAAGADELVEVPYR